VSLPPDIAVAIDELLLAEDVVDYMSCCAVYVPWRAWTPSPHDPTLRDACFRPCGWSLYATETASGRPTLVRSHSSTRPPAGAPTSPCPSSSSTGSSASRTTLRHPDQQEHHRASCCPPVHPPLAPIFRSFVRDVYSIAWMNAAVCSSHTPSIAVVAGLVPQCAGSDLRRTGAPPMDGHPRTP
jgi:hypothetical protein